MKDGKHPNPNTIHPIAGYDKEIYVKPTITNPNIIVGDFTYIADSDFESHVSHLYEWNDDKLIIGKFCQIAAGVEFVMNGANHQMNAVSTFPFYTLEGWEMSPPAKTDLPLKGDTVIENDVWIGQNSVILPGVHIGDGAIIGANSVVGSDVPPYTKVVGNPARAIQKRFDDELIELLMRFKWWDRSIQQIEAELDEKLDKLPDILTDDGYPDVQAFMKTYRKAEAIVIQYNQDLAEWEQAVKNGQKPAEKQHRPPERQSVRNRLRQLQEDGKQNSQPKQRKKSQDRER